MSSVAFDFEWIDVLGRTAADVAATMARFEIQIGDQVVTRAFDKRGRSVREGIITPLAPIAEWIAANWWTLFEECATPARSRHEFASRHNLRFAERGFPLPDLRFTPDGETTICEWQPRTTQFGTIDFFGSGTAQVESTLLRDTLWSFVEAVVARLNERQGSESCLPELWDCVRATTLEEEQFCRIAGRLGLDPYEVDGELADQLNKLDEELPSAVRDEFASAVTTSNLEESMQWVTTGLDELRNIMKTAVPPISHHQVSVESSSGTPWSYGYRLARDYRATLDQPGHGRLDIENICTEEPVLASFGTPPIGLNAVIRNHAGRPLVYSVKQRPESLRFLLARALFTCYEPSGVVESLITTAETAWQKKSRAFAAELLAPSDYLRMQISRDTLGPDDISDLAAELEVSTWVVERQIVNHKLAKIEP